MFSQRTFWTQEINEITSELKNQRQKNNTIIDLTIANPTKAGFIGDPAIFRQLATSENLIYEPNAFGALAARAAVATYYQRHGLSSIDINHICLTAGTSEAYFYLLTMCCDAGDAILVPYPSYPLFPYIADMLNIRIVYYSLSYDNEWHIVPSSIEQALGQTQNPRAIIVVSPNHPTGHYLKQADFRFLERTCANDNLVLIVDEVFHDYPLTQTFAPPRFAASQCLQATVSGLSKVALLPQMKLSWIVFNGLQALCQEACHRLEMMADTFLNVNSLSQSMLPYLLEHADRWQHPVKNRLKDNLAYAHQRTKDSPIHCLKAEGGWSMILQIPRHAEKNSFSLDLLIKHHILTHPGHFYGMEDHMIVISLLTKPDIFQLGLDCLVNHLESWLAST